MYFGEDKYHQRILEKDKAHKRIMEDIYRKREEGSGRYVGRGLGSQFATLSSKIWSGYTYKQKGLYFYRIDKGLKTTNDFNRISDVEFKELENLQMVENRNIALKEDLLKQKEMKSKKLTENYRRTNFRREKKEVIENSMRGLQSDTLKK